MKPIKFLSLIALSLSLVACGGIKTQEDIAQMSPKEVAELACNSLKSVEVEQLKLLMAERKHKQLIEKSQDERFTARAGRLDCEITNVSKKTFRGQEGTIVSFAKGRDMKVYKEDGQYRIDF